MEFVSKLVVAWNYATGKTKCPCSHPLKDHYKPSPIRNGQCNYDGCMCDHSMANSEQSLFDDLKTRIKNIRGGK